MSGDRFAMGELNHDARFRPNEGLLSAAFCWRLHQDRHAVSARMKSSGLFLFWHLCRWLDARLRRRRRNFCLPRSIHAVICCVPYSTLSTCFLHAVDMMATQAPAVSCRPIYAAAGNTRSRHQDPESKDLALLPVIRTATRGSP